MEGCCRPAQFMTAVCDKTPDPSPISALNHLTNFHETLGVCMLNGNAYA